MVTRIGLAFGRQVSQRKTASRTFERAYDLVQTSGNTNTPRTRRGEMKGRPGPHGQDGWANIWCAVLAVCWPTRWGCRSLSRAGRTGGAAVALAAQTLHYIEVGR